MREKRIQIEGQDTAYLIRDDGTVWSEKRNRILKGTVERNEYHTVYLSHNGQQYNLMIHRLVAEAFCENPNNYTIVHHKDNNSLNNKADNLEWVSIKENNLTENRKVVDKKVCVKEKPDMNKEWFPLSINKNYGINKDGEVINFKTKKLIKGSQRNNYLRVQINGHYYSIHRLIYETFIGPIPEGMLIDHIDGNRSNNSLSNLRLTTQSENMKNSMINGHNGQIPILQFDKQGNFIQEFPTIQAAADAVGRTHAAIRTAILRNGTSGGFIWKKKN